MRRMTIVLAVSTLLLTGCGLVPKSVKIVDARISSDGMVLDVSVDACNADLSFEMDEDFTSVALWVSARSGTDEDCLDQLTVDLEDPLGGRILIDGHDFTEVEVEFSG